MQNFFGGGGQLSCILHTYIHILYLTSNLKQLKISQYLRVSSSINYGRCVSGEYNEFVKAAWPSGSAAGPAIWWLRGNLEALANFILCSAKFKSSCIKISYQKNINFVYALMVKFIKQNNRIIKNPDIFIKTNLTIYLHFFISRKWMLSFVLCVSNLYKMCQSHSLLLSLLSWLR